MVRALRVIPPFPQEARKGWGGRLFFRRLSARLKPFPFKRTRVSQVPKTGGFGKPQAHFGTYSSWRNQLLERPSTAVAGG